MFEQLTASAVGAIAGCASVDDVAAGFAEAIAPFGMTASASGMVSGARSLGHNPFHFATWPAAWMKVYRANDFVTIDPLPRWAIISGEALSWGDIVERLDRTDPGLAVYRLAMDYGFHEGFATPVRGASGNLGLVSVGGGKRAPFSLDEKLYLQAVSIAVNNRCEALLGGVRRAPGIFTLREQECIALLCQGFSDPEIARVIAVSLSTVKFHMENARKKVGARNRVELAVMSQSFIGRSSEVPA